jgi:hypothetical protein
MSLAVPQPREGICIMMFATTACVTNVLYLLRQAQWDRSRQLIRQQIATGNGAKRQQYAADPYK